MELRVCICAKQIPNPEIASSVFRVDEDRNEVVLLSGTPLVMSPFDEQGVEAALRLRDKGVEVKITVATFGPDAARQVLKHGLSMGADEGIHLSDSGLEQADSYLVALALAAAIRKAGPFDLILAGRQAADWDAGVVGCGIAELLGLPVVTFAKSVSIEAGAAVIERVVDDGFETVETPLPCVVTVSNELGEPRKPALRETMRAARKPVATWKLQDVALDGAGDERSPRQTRERLYIPVKEGRCELFKEGSAQDIARALVSRLSESKLV